MFWINGCAFVLLLNNMKGQTIIEPTLDMWTREKRLNNILVNDPKGGVPRSIVKSYSLVA